jgi:hypothetical protein
MVPSPPRSENCSERSQFFVPLITELSLQGYAEVIQDLHNLYECLHTHHRKMEPNTEERRYKRMHMGTVRHLEFLIAFRTIHPKDAVVWNMTPCGSSKNNRRFRGTYRLHLHGNIALSFPSSRRAGKTHFVTLKMETIAPPRRRFFLLEPRGVIFQKKTSLIVTDMKNYPRRQYSSILVGE